MGPLSSKSASINLRNCGDVDVIGKRPFVYSMVHRVIQYSGTSLVVQSFWPRRGFQFKRGFHSTSSRREILGKKKFGINILSFLWTNSALMSALNVLIALK